MDRRSFIAGTLSLLGAPLVAEAQTAGRVYRIGFLGPSPSSDDLDGFRQGLRELGWVDGQNISIEVRWTEARTERLPELVAELIRLKVDVIYTSMVAAAQAAKRATATTPIVVTTAADLVRAGLVASLARPGSNVTGVGGGIQLRNGWRCSRRRSQQPPEWPSSGIRAIPPTNFI